MSAPLPLAVEPTTYLPRKRRSSDGPPPILRDGEVLRVPLMLMDRAPKQGVSDGLIVIDCGCGPVSVPRLAYEAARASRRAAYDQFVAELGSPV